MLKKLKRWFHMTFVSFFYGMKGADEAIVNPSTSESGEITQKQDLKGNVFSEMLQEQQKPLLNWHRYTKMLISLLYLLVVVK